MKFYIAAPFSTLDVSTPSGDQIVIEERDPTEVTPTTAAFLQNELCRLVILSIFRCRALSGCSEHRCLLVHNSRRSSVSQNLW